VHVRQHVTEPFLFHPRARVRQHLARHHALKKLSRTARHVRARAVVVDRGHAAELQPPGRGRPAPERVRARTPRTGGHHPVARRPASCASGGRRRLAGPNLCHKEARYLVSIFSI